MVYNRDAECKSQIQNKEALHLSLPGWRDVGKVAERFLCAEEMEGTFLWERTGQGRMLMCWMSVSAAIFHIMLRSTWEASVALLGSLMWLTQVGPR